MEIKGYLRFYGKCVKRVSRILVQMFLKVSKSVYWYSEKRFILEKL